MNKILSSSTCSITVFFIRPYFIKNDAILGQYHILNVVNGMLAGAVSITAPCNNDENYAAIIIGFIGAFVYIGACIMHIKLKVDDPVEAS